MKLAWIPVCLLLILGGCSTSERPPPPADSLELWTVSELDIQVAHSSSIDEATGYVHHIEYHAARLERGTDVLMVIYRPIDFPDGRPGFAIGDQLMLAGLADAKDLGYTDERDVWIDDISIRHVKDRG